VRPSYHAEQIQISPLSSQEAGLPILPEANTDAAQAHAVAAISSSTVTTISGGGVGVRWIQGIIAVPSGLGTLPDELVVQPLIPALPAAHVRREAIIGITPEDRLIPVPAKFIIRVDYREEQSQRKLYLAPLGSGERVERDLLLHRLTMWHRGHLPTEP